MSETVDVIICGGGPAGACAAAFARQANLSALVLEREKFPRFRIGESLLPHGNALLRAAGVWEKIERAGFIEKRGAFFHSGDGSATREVIFANGIVPGLDRTFQVERARFDQILLDHARDCGADVLQGASVTRVDETAEGVTVHYQHGGKALVARARWLLDGSGRDRHFSTPLKDVFDAPRLERRAAIYTHVHGARRAPGIQAGHTIIVRLEDGWFWLIPIDANRTSVGLVTTVAAIRASGGSPQALFEREVRSSAKLRELIGEAKPVMEFKVTADYSYFRRDLAQGRTLLLGDAAGFLDPIFSSGVYLAVSSAQDAVNLIRRADAENRPLRASECRRYTRGIKRHAAVFERLIHAFYDNASFAVFMSPGAPLGVDRGINAIVAGHSTLTWPVWWRFRLFLLVCRLQRRMALVPRLPLRSDRHAGE